MKRKEFLGSVAAMVGAATLLGSKSLAKEPERVAATGSPIEIDMGKIPDGYTVEQVLDTYHKTGVLLYTQPPYPIWPCFNSTFYKGADLKLNRCSIMSRVRVQHNDKWYLVLCRTDRVAHSETPLEELQRDAMQDFALNVWRVQTHLKIDPTLAYDGVDLYPLDIHQGPEVERIF